MVEQFSPAVLGAAAGFVSGVFGMGLFVGALKKTVNGAVSATHRIERKLDEHIKTEEEDKAKISRLEGILEEMRRKL